MFVLRINTQFCNTLVLGLLREALIAQARLALGRLPAAERGTSALTNNLGRLLMDMGKLEEARPLLEKVMRRARRRWATATRAR